ncbi:MAG TPA: hypothetical protein VML55_11740, partial [Planctomycetaceae bacterium]|nr:hypothetical protein [Planctomycetaceae bacterium]
ELLTPGTRCGIEIVPHQPEQLDQQFDPQNYAGRLVVAVGDVRIADATGWSRSLSSDHVLTLTPGERAMAQVEFVSSPPVWLLSDTGLETSVSRQIASQFEQELTPDALLIRLKPLVKSGRPRVSELGVKAQGLLEFGDDLVIDLSYSDLWGEARLAAIDELRTWLGSGPGRGEPLRSALEGALPAEKVDTIYELLWGYRVEDLQNEFTSQKLARYLDDGHVAVRQLAHYHIKRLTGNDFRYNPLDPATRRRIAVDNIRDHIRQKGSLLAR